MACTTDHKLDEAPVVYTVEVDMKNEPREAMGPTNDVWEASDWKN